MLVWISSCGGRHQYERQQGVDVQESYAETFIGPGLRGSHFAGCWAVIGVISAVAGKTIRGTPDPANIHAKRRQRIRSTFFQYARLEGSQVCFVFVLGKNASGVVDASGGAVLEAQRDKDLVWVDAQDTNIAAKAFAWFYAAVRELPHAAFVGKCDDDTFVQPAALAKDLRTLGEGGLHYVGQIMWITGWTPVAGPRGEAGAGKPCLYGGTLDGNSKVGHIPGRLKRRQRARCNASVPGGSLTGIYPYAAGPLYLLSKGLLATVMRHGATVRLAAAQGFDVRGEDATIGYIIHRAMHAVNGSYTLAHLTWTKLVDVSGQVLFDRARRAGGGQYVHPTPSSYVVHKLKTGDNTYWGEVHRVLNESQDICFPLVQATWHPQPPAVTMEDTIARWWRDYMKGGQRTTGVPDVTSVAHPCSALFPTTSSLRSMGLPPALPATSRCARGRQRRARVPGAGAQLLTGPFLGAPDGPTNID